MTWSPSRIVLASTLLAAFPAWAAVSSEAKAGIQIQLSKTDPLDAQAPTITFGDIGRTRILTGHAGFRDLPDGPFHDQAMEVDRAGAAPFEDTVGSATQGPVTTHGSIQAAASALGPHLAISGGSVVDEGTAGRRTIYESYTAPFGFENFQRFTLSPHTLVTFVIDYELSAITSIGSHDALGTQEGAQAGFSMFLSTGPGFEGIFSEAYEFIEALETVQSPQNLHRQGQMTLSFQNTSDELASAYFWGDTYARGYTTGAIPEPASMALLLGGLCVLACRARTSVSRAKP